MIGTSIGNSLIWDNGTNVGIGNTNTTYTFDVTGTGRFTSSVTSGLNGFNALGAYGFTSYEGAAASGKSTSFSLAYFNSIDAIYQSSGNTNDFGIWTNGGTSSQPKFYIKNGGNVGIGTSSPSTTFNGLDISSGGLSLIIGADNGASTRTNATQKVARFGSYNYTNANAPVGMMLANNDGTDNLLLLGGGSGSFVAATQIQFYTAANNNTASGTERMRITSGGYSLFSNNGTYINAGAGYHQFSTNAASEWIAGFKSTGTGPYGVFIDTSTNSSVQSSFQVYTNSGTGLRLTNDSTLMLGRTTVFSTFGDSNGIVQYAGGTIYCAADGSESMGLSRRTNDGIILIFRKGTTTVGSISTNTYSLPSDLNFKKNINTLDLGLNLINKLRPVSYNHKIDDDDTALSTGFIAQELEKSLNELGVEENKYHILQHKVNEDETQSQYWVDYTKMIPVLVKAIQEQQIQIQNLQEQINILAK